MRRLFKRLRRRISRYILTSKSVSLINVWEKDTTNLGDLVCSPSLYFERLRQNAMDVPLLRFRERLDFKNKTIIVGGGGVFIPYFRTALDNILSIAHQNKVIFWGVGYDNYIEDELPYDFDTSGAFITAVRDFNYKNLRYVPCSSCLSPLFDHYVGRTASAKYALYVHRDYSAPILRDLQHLPTCINTEVPNLEDVLSFFSDHEIILTNSFHGLYWATLLGKKVIVLPWVTREGKIGFSFKFKSVKYKPIYCENWLEYTNVESELRNYPESLGDARRLNQEFFQEIERILDVIDRK